MFVGGSWQKIQLGKVTWRIYFYGASTVDALAQMVDENANTSDGGSDSHLARTCNFADAFSKQVHIIQVQ